MQAPITNLGIPHKTVSSIKFSCFSAEEIRQLSVKRVTNPHCFDSLDTAVPGGLYDPSYGSSSLKEACSTCNQISCSGHLGHIELPLPVYNPVFFKQLLSLVKSSCHKCKRFCAPKDELLLFAAQLQALRRGNLEILVALKEARNLLFDKDVLSSDDSSASYLLELKYNLDAILMQQEKSDSGEQSSKGFWTRHCMDAYLRICKDFTARTKEINQKKCPHCKEKRVIAGGEYTSSIYFKSSTTKEAKRQYVTPSHIRDLLKGVWKNEKYLLSIMLSGITGTRDDDSPIDALFLETLSVPSPTFRPVRYVNGTTIEDTQSTLYSTIMMDCKIISLLMKTIGENSDKNIDEIDVGSSGLKFMNLDVFDTIPGFTLPEKMGSAWKKLQQHVNAVMDSDLDRFDKFNKNNGIRQLLEKKDGLFRKHMMGKRVNYAARSVISPDPYIATNEIGVPLVFAKKLTYPTAVTSRNIKQLRQAVINGPANHPGASHVILNGEKKYLKKDNKSQREAIAKQLIASADTKNSSNVLCQPNIVLRYLQTGDVLLINRQPTLHRGSIMAHKARVLPGEKTLRLHYANCKSYNADFDGDEMNAHFPQSELGRAEAMTLMLTDNQYLSAKDGKPLSCLIQDHMVAGVNMCLRGRFFRRDEYQSLIYVALMRLPVKIKLLPPAILKPERLWSGKQILSSLLINVIPSDKPRISLLGKSKISARDWKNGASRQPRVAALQAGEMCESQVVIRQGELLCGILDKAHYGASEFGLVHTMFEVYGGDISGKMLTCLARLFTAYLQLYKGFTLGVEDILTTDQGDRKRKEIIEESLNSGLTSVADSLGLENSSNPEEVVRKFQQAHTAVCLNPKTGKSLMASIDHSMKQLSNSVNNQISQSCSGTGLIKTFPNNNLQLMVTSGAKGGMVNCLQISCSLGQIELEGQRPSMTFAGRTCPSFKPFDTSLRAGGFVSQRFLTGLRPQEYYFHCMAGREGLVDTAVKTSNSGYLQRCLVKSLESLILSYDLTVRDNGGDVVQFLYGDDGVDVSKSSFLKRKQFDFLLDNLPVISKQLPPIEKLERYFDMEVAEKKWKKYFKSKRKCERKMRKLENCPQRRESGFLSFAQTTQFESKEQLVGAWRNSSEEERSKFKKKAQKVTMSDPVISQLRPDLNFGSTSEFYRDEYRRYLNENSTKYRSEDERNKKPTLKELERIFELRYQRSLCEPGEDVGLLASQSVGEPSTQMTLNTFHFAGRGEMNVTLGIPRLREILMSNVTIPRTPHISVPVLPGKQHRARKLCKKFATVHLSEVLHKFEVKESVKSRGANRNRKCVLKISILPEKQLRKVAGLSHFHIMRYIETRFIKTLISELAAQVKKGKIEDYTYDNPEGTSGGERLDIEEKEDYENKNEAATQEEDVVDSDEDDGAEGVEEKRKKDDEVEYEEDDDDNNDVASDNDDNNNDVASDNDDNNNDDDDELTDVENTNNERLEAAGLKSSEDQDSRKLAAQRVKVENVYVEDYQVKESNRSCKITIMMPLKSFNADMVSIVRTCASSSYLRKTRDINRCMLVPDQQLGNDAMKFVLEGYNFFKLFENENCFDLTKLYSNCIRAIADIYGIEAARSVIVQEVVNVFAVYGIEIDRRHLSLLADFMCVDGVPKGCNRRAIEVCSSPLQQITFETGCNFLTKAALHGFTDHLGSPSSSMVAGRVVKAGTGSFSLVYPLTKSI